jgi:hypothetical protein
MRAGNKLTGRGLNGSSSSQSTRLIDPVESGREQFLFKFRSVVCAKKEIATGECCANVCLGTTAVAAVKGREGVVHLIDCGVFCSGVRHGLLLLLGGG